VRKGRALQAAEKLQFDVDVRRGTTSVVPKKPIKCDGLQPLCELTAR
jgi:hypothetical protein